MKPTHFLNGWWQGMRKGSRTTILCENDRGQSAEAAQTVAKPGLTARKVLLCIWWDWKEIIYYELFPYGQTLNSIYCQQLDSLKLAIDQKWPAEEVLCSIRTAPGSHTSVVTRQKL
ncbi:mariner transposase [Trichonephila clavipes]|nr:mariner transposase [Trichonephila clavipes]